MHRAAATSAKTLRSFVLTAALASWFSGCSEPCRYDADCDASAGLTRCDVETGACEPLTPAAAPSCDDVADCEGGRVCADGACRFAPSCQRVTDGAVFDYIASCAGGVVVTGTATASTNGCRVALTLSDVLGGDARVVLDPIPATEGDLVQVTTSSEGDLSCSAGSWSAAQSGASLPGCSLPGGQTCDVGLLRQSAGPICLADGTGCDDTRTCEPIGTRPTDVGGCR